MDRGIDLFWGAEVSIKSRVDTQTRAVPPTVESRSIIKVEIQHVQSAVANISTARGTEERVSGVFSWLEASISGKMEQLLRI